MKLYYLNDGESQSGPFSLEELRDKSILQETYVWKEGMSDWLKAEEIPELKVLFIKTPPLFKASLSLPDSPINLKTVSPTSSVEKTGSWVGRNLKKSIILLILVCIAAYLIFNNGIISGTSMPFGNNNKSPEELRMELSENEKQNPTDYLVSNIAMKSNVLGQKVFEDTITNNASIAAFKDISITITYLSKTESVISEETFKIYEVIKPLHSMTIDKIKTFAPNGTEGFSAAIIDAKPVE